MKLGRCAGIIFKTAEPALFVEGIRRVQGEMWLDRACRRSSPGRSANPSRTGIPCTESCTRTSLSKREWRSSDSLPRVTGTRKSRRGCPSVIRQSKIHLHNIFDKLGVTDRLELGAVTPFTPGIEVPNERRKRSAPRPADTASAIPGDDTRDEPAPQHGICVDILGRIPISWNGMAGLQGDADRHRRRPQALALVKPPSPAKSSKSSRPPIRNRGWRWHIRPAPSPIALIDLRMPKMSGLELLDRFVGIDPGIEVLVVTATIPPPRPWRRFTGARATTSPSPWTSRRSRTGGGLIAEALSRQHAQTRSGTDRSVPVRRIVGRSPAHAGRVRASAPRCSPLPHGAGDGPTGTGKELVARALHRLGPVRTPARSPCAVARR